MSWNTMVTPCVGVWIEIFGVQGKGTAAQVTPCVGVWIEIQLAAASGVSIPVTPCVGVWIEISAPLCVPHDVDRSLPAWECGLKLDFSDSCMNHRRVTPCVGVWIEITTLTKEV